MTDRFTSARVTRAIQQALLRSQRGILRLATAGLVATFLMSIVGPAAVMAIPLSAVDDNYAVAKNVTLTVAAPGVLGNDIAGSTYADLISSPANGFLNMATNGSFSYEPDPGFIGTDTFTYEACTGPGACDPTAATVTITVSNSAPVAIADSKTVLEDSSATIIDAMANDTDANGDPIRYQALHQPVNGTVTVNGSGPTATFSYTPNANFSGTDTFTYSVRDATLISALATVTVTVTGVNDAPSFTGGGAVTVGEDSGAYSAPWATAISSGAGESDTVSFSLTQDSTGLFASGPAIAANGTLSFTLVPNANGVAHVSATIHDNGGTANGGSDTGNTVAFDITVTASNDTTVCSSPTLTVNEDAVLSGDLNDLCSDVDSNLTYGLVISPSDGTLELNPAGAWAYTPNADFHGTDQFQFIADDGAGNSVPATVTFTVAAVNDAPTFTIAGDQTVAEDAGAQTVAGFLSAASAGPADEVGQTLTVAVTNDANSLFAVQPSINLNTGDLTYTPAANANGVATVSVTVSDDGGTALGGVDATTQTFLITVSAVNDAPVGVADAYTVDEDSILNVESPAVLTNDTDTELQTLSVASHTEPSDGQLTMTSDGEFSYVPDADFNGTDTFTYVPSDGTADGAAVTVTITVTAVNDAPVAVDDAYSVNEDAVLTVAAPGLIGNDTDVDLDGLSVDSNGGADHGTISVAGDGSFVYTPDPNFNGTDSFRYTVNDGQVQSFGATVTITVNAVDDGVTAVDDAYTVAEDSGTDLFPLANDTNVDASDTMTIVTAGPATHGTVTLSTDHLSVFYAPAADFNGTDTFSYDVSDGQGNVDTGLVTVTVAAVNDAPVGADDAYNTNEDTALVVPAPGLLANDSDVDLDTIAPINISQGQHGTVTNAGADGHFTYTPAANFFGTDTFTYDLYDGTTTSGPYTVTVTVASVNDPVIAVTDTFSVYEDATSSLDVLANDTDADVDLLRVTLVGIASHGTVSIPLGGLSVRYVPDADYTGPDSFVYTASDGNGSTAGATVNLTVAAVNDAPSFRTGDPPFVTEDDGARVFQGFVDQLSAGPADEAGQVLSILVTNDANALFSSQPSIALPSGDLSFTPAPDANGVATVTVTVSDDGGVLDGGDDSTTHTFQITINAANDAPVGVTDSIVTAEDTAVGLASVLTNDTDIDAGAVLSIASATNGAHGTVTNVGSAFTYTPDLNYNGSDTFTYMLTDGVATVGPVTVNVTISAVNDAPVGVTDTLTVNEDTATTLFVRANDSDPEGQAFRVAVVGSASHGTLTIPVGGQNVVYTPDAEYSGPDSFSYTLTDGTATSGFILVNLTVVAVNDAPVGVADTRTVAEDGVLTGSSVLANDTDIDGDTLIVVGNSAPNHGTVGTVNANGTFTYTPVADYVGTDTFTYMVSDGNLTVGPVTVTITVTPVNDAPVGVADSRSVAAGGTLVSASVLANDTDIDGGPLTVVSNTAVSHGSAVTVASDGTFTYTPTAGYTGTDTFTYMLTDGFVAVGPVTVTITVVPDSTAPVVTTPVVTLGAGRVTTMIPMLVSWTAIDEVSGSGIASMHVQVSKDGGGFMDLYTGSATSTTAMVFRNHTYAFRVMATDAASNASAWSTASDIRTGSITQSSEGTITFAAHTWTYVRPATAPTYHYATTKGWSASFTFTSREIVWIGLKSAASGKGTVYIDGVRVSTVDLFRSSTLTGQQLFKHVFSSAAKHTIKIVVAEAGKRVNLDEFVVLR